MHGLYGQKKAYGFGTRPYCDASFPVKPLPNEIFYNTTDKKMYIFIGIGEPGCDANGWFNLKNAQYSS